jgi:hypothetical protein
VKNLVFLLFLVLVGFSVAGYFLNWYKFTDDKSAAGHRHLSIDIDTNKVGQDLKKGETRLGETIQNLNQETPASADGANKPGAVDQKTTTPPQLQPPKQ